MVTDHKISPCIRNLLSSALQDTDIIPKCKLYLNVSIIIF